MGHAQGGVSHRLVVELHVVWVKPLGVPQHSRSTQAAPAHVWFVLEAPASRKQLYRVHMEPGILGRGSEEPPGSSKCTPPEEPPGSSERALPLGRDPGGGAGSAPPLCLSAAFPSYNL
eukprot:6327302-Amphidinium_carterae.1